MYGLTELFQGLQGALNGVNHATKDWTGVLTGSAKEINAMADGFGRAETEAKEVGNAFNVLSQNAKKTKGFFGDLTAAMNGIGPKTLATGEFVGFIKGLPYLVNQLIAPLNEWSLQMSNQRKEMIRGTAAIGTSVEAMQVNTRGFVDASTTLQIETGLSGEQMGQLAASYVEAQALLGQSTNTTDAATQEYLKTMGNVAKLTGMGAGAMGEFNKKLSVGLKLGMGAKTHINQMMVAANAMGIKGEEAQKVIMNGWDTMLSIRVEDRDAFAKTLLESAALISKSGIDFGKYTNKLTESKGSKLMLEAAKLAALSGRQYGPMLAALTTLQMTGGKSKAAMAEIIDARKDASARHSHTSREELDRIQAKNSRGEIMTTAEANSIVTSQAIFQGMKSEEITGSSPEEAITLENVQKSLQSVMADVAKAFKENALPTAKIISDIMQDNKTAADRIHTNEMEFAKNVKLLSDNAMKAADAMNTYTGTLSKITGPITDMLLGGLGAYQAGKFALGKGKALLGGRELTTGVRAAETMAEATGVGGKVRGAAKVLGRSARLLGTEILAPLTAGYELIRADLTNHSKIENTGESRLTKAKQHFGSTVVGGLSDAIDDIDLSRYLPGMGGQGLFDRTLRFADKHSLDNGKLSLEDLQKLGVNTDVGRKWSDMMAEGYEAKWKAEHPEAEPLKVDKVMDKEDDEPDLNAPPEGIETKMEKKPEELAPLLRNIESLLAQQVQYQADGSEMSLHDVFAA